MRVLVREPQKLSIRLDPVGALIAGALCAGIGAFAVSMRLDPVLFVFGAVFLAFGALCFFRMRFVSLTINLRDQQVVIERWGVLGKDHLSFDASEFSGLVLEERQHSFNGESEGSSYRLSVKTLGGSAPLVEDFDFDRKSKLAAVNLVRAFLDSEKASA
jgi:hypothetical protein